MAGLRSAGRVKSILRPHISGAMATASRFRGNVARQPIGSRQGRGVIGTIVRQRDIIDRQKLGEQLSAAARSTKSPSLDRPPLVAVLKAALARGRAEIRCRFDE